MDAEELTYRSKTEVVERYIRTKLQSGEIQPGQRLRQDLLAEQLKVSSTPVREALRRLEAEGLVVHVPNKGVTVREADRPEVREAYALRALLEGYATRQATPRLSGQELELLTSLHHTMIALRDAGDLRTFSAINDRWHVTIYRTAGSRLLESQIRSVWTACPWDAVWAIPGRPDGTIEEHQRVLEALVDRDEVRAEAAMAEHIRSGEQRLLEFLGKTG